MKENIKHLKLTNNDEIVCEIVSYPDNEESDEVVNRDDNDDDAIARRAKMPSKPCLREVHAT